MPSAIHVDESVGQAVFNVVYINGVISRDVIIEFFSEDGSSQGIVTCIN